MLHYSAQLGTENEDKLLKNLDGEALDEILE